VIVLPAMSQAQEQGWHALLDLYEAHPEEWTLIGGQMVHLHCAERGFEPGRPSADGIQHRWTRGAAVIDVLVPEGLSERAGKRVSASGFPTVAAPGGTQALNRSEVVEVQVGGRVGHVRRPVLLSAMIMKAAARLETYGLGLERHCYDFAVLAAMLASGDTAVFDLTAKDKKRLRTMIERTRAVPEALEQNPTAERRLERLEAVVGS
jgi:hypothetical protein